MHRLVILLFTITLLNLVNSGCKTEAEPRAELQEKLQKILDQHLTKYSKSFPGRKIGFGLFVKLKGKNDEDTSSQNMYVSSGFPTEYGEGIQFRGASTTKSFTAAAILKLHQQEKLNIDDLITADIPGSNEPYIPATDEYAIPNKDRITIRLLLQHRAGVFDITNSAIPDTVHAPYHGQKYPGYMVDQKAGENHTFTIPEMVKVVAQQHLSYFKPNESFHYSNTGYHLLAVIIERISGKRYSQFLQDEFLTPLQLRHTHFPYLGTDQAIPKPYVSSWIKIQDVVEERDEDNISSIVADGNIITTPADLASWASELYGSNRVLNAEMHKQMTVGIPTHEEHVNYVSKKKR